MEGRDGRVRIVILIGKGGMSQFWAADPADVLATVVSMDTILLPVISTGTKN